MKTTFLNLLFAGLFIPGVALTGCSKSETMNDLNNNAQTITAEDPGDGHTVGLGLLNKEFVVYYALDSAVDITRQFNTYSFKFAGKEPSGQAQVWHNQQLQTGSWNMFVAPDIISISYPTNTSPELAFMNRNWTITGSSSSVIRLVATDGDEIQLTAK